MPDRLERQMAANRITKNVKIDTAVVGCLPPTQAKDPHPHPPSAYISSFEIRLIGNHGYGRLFLFAPRHARFHGKILSFLLRSIVMYA